VDELDIFDELAVPFPPNLVHWRIGATNAKKLNVNPWEATMGIPLAYIDARDVMRRLDDVMGPENWQDHYTETPKRLLCTLSLKINGEWIAKSDGAGDTDTEGAKGGISDAFKRAGVKWGIGRYLYYCKAEWIDLENGRIPKNFNGREYLPAPAFSSKQQKTKYWKGLRDAIAEDDGLKAKELYAELDNEQKLELNREFSSGQRAVLKELV
jgi:hypothetical protein